MWTVGKAATPLLPEPCSNVIRGGAKALSRGDRELIRKLRNRQSAFVSRERKKAQMMHLERTVHELKRENRRLKEEVSKYREFYGPLEVSESLVDGGNTTLPLECELNTHPVSKEGDLFDHINDSASANSVTFKPAPQLIEITNLDKMKTQGVGVANAGASALLHDCNSKSEDSGEPHSEELLNKRRERHSNYLCKSKSFQMQRRDASSIGVYGSITPAIDLLSDIATFSSGSQHWNEVSSLPSQEIYNSIGNMFSSASDNVFGCNVTAYQAPMSSGTPLLQKDCYTENMTECSSRWPCDADYFCHSSYNGSSIGNSHQQSYDTAASSTDLNTPNGCLNEDIYDPTSGFRRGNRQDPSDASNWIRHDEGQGYNGRGTL